MASKPESNFIKRVHNALKVFYVYHEKMHNMYRGGTADVWYSGTKSDLWIEYKWLPKTPKRTPIPALSELQVEWIKARRQEYRDVWVVVGYPGGCDVWRNDATVRAMCSVPDLARLIFDHTGASPCLSQLTSSPLPASFKRRTKSLPQASS